MDNFIDLIKAGAKDIGLQLSESQSNSFYNYYETLIEWNQKMNLTAITDMKEVIIKHFLDSLLVFKVGPFPQKTTLLDLGTGAGFPGVPLKIVDPNIEVVLMDSLKKRVEFLKGLISHLNLEKIDAIHGRAEEFGRSAEYREGFNIVVSRAVARLNILSEYCLPFVAPGGKFIALKGPNAGQEIKDSYKAFEILGGKIVQTEEFTLPFSNDIRTLVVIEKISPTPEKYPRKAGMPEKRPL